MLNCFCNLIQGLISCVELNLILISCYLFPAVEVRKSLHLRLGLPFDRPLLRVANALNLSTTDDVKSESIQKSNRSPSKFAMF